MKRPENKITIIGAGIASALEAYYAYKYALENNISLRITMLDKINSIAETTASNLAFSLTPDEILSVVPPAPVLMEKMRVLFSEPGGIRIDDVPGINESAVKAEFIKQVQDYNNIPYAYEHRQQALLKLGKFSMDEWQRIYDESDQELKNILEESNFQPCREPKNSTTALHDGYRIDLIYNIPDAASKANAMQISYKALGYTKCRVLSPEDVIAIDPFLKDFCENHTEQSSSGAKIWKADATALFRPGGCLDAEVFLPKFYAYLERKMGTYINAEGKLKNCFRLKFNRRIDGVIFDDTKKHLIVSALVSGNTLKYDKHKYVKSEYIFCPGESVGTLKKFGFEEPAFTGFAGASLKLNIYLTTDEIEQLTTFNHCMEVYREGVVLAWQARLKNGKLSVAVGGTKAFYADQRPHKNHDFAKNRNLLQLNMMNDVLPWAIKKAFKTAGLQYHTKQELTASDLAALENAGIAKRWVGTRAVAYDGFPTFGELYVDGRKVENASTTTHLGSGGCAFAPSVQFSKPSRKKLLELVEQQFMNDILSYSASNRTTLKAKL